MKPTAPDPGPADRAPPAADLRTAWNAMLEERRRAQEAPDEPDAPASDAVPPDAPPVEASVPAGAAAPPPAAPPPARPRRPLRVAVTVGTIAALAGGNGYLGWQLQKTGETADRLAVDVERLQGERAQDAAARGELTRARDDLQQRLDDMRARTGGLEQKLEKASAESETLARERAELERAIEQKTKQAQANAERADALRGEVEQLAEQKKQLEQRQDELAKEKAKLFDQLGETKEALDQARKKLDGLQKTLDAIVAAGHDLETLQRKGPPRVTAKVLTVLNDANPRGAIVSAGKADRIVKGDVFYVFRGETEVGRLEVRSVDASRAAAMIVHLQPGQDIRTGDEARTFR